MKVYVLVGAGSRALYMFAKPMSAEWQEHVAFKGVYDINPVRAALLSQECGNVPVYDDFHKMLADVRPDVVVVASTDYTHHTYIIDSLRAGCDVITEKPMTIDEEKCRQILQAEKETGKKVTVTFNLRFAPYFAKVKELLLEGAIGDLYHVHLEWYLDRRHGADYFRRWHSELAKSGGLLVHKSTHHFDIINWWMASRPAEVHAFGARRVYGDNRAEKGERCLTCAYKSSCEYYMDIEQNPFMETYYHQAEQEDGYIRDRCLFDERIDIYDTMSVNVRYENEALLTYSLVAYSPVEGWRATLNGSGGRMELTNEYSNADMRQSDVSLIKITRPDGTVEQIEVVTSAAGHGGGDAKLRQALFAGNVEDPLGQQADSSIGADSLLIGATANRSIAEGRAVRFPDMTAASAASGQGSR
ncbi:Oxidoreductase family, C-terminal alpha/beta domain [Paenibacillus sp. UNCCL117]|uniref:Gfo/Idh/MocA family protein n=1 Tax=unclassified Paenibacillus TaxID=185978 RepID=UPI0008884AF1|nr:MULTISPECIES: Gfo/Idh/MocA family oxidoreductase [unclassified Paenibacillus]SDC66782.1 Oxidoreductase family, C-terminal alpha/beta domain [Paenibacillus sp. cl123]SFW23142.1 Oxidoreductase family, C-terminal alpha/beta domain [Paenibacillus sp. UNCCL117]